MDTKEGGETRLASTAINDQAKANEIPSTDQTQSKKEQKLPETSTETAAVTTTFTGTDGDEDGWEKIEYTETEEGKAPSHVAWGHMHLKIGPKDRQKTIFSVDWSKLTYED